MTTKDYADALITLAANRENLGTDADVTNIRRVIVNPRIDEATVTRLWAELCEEVDRLRSLDVGRLEPFDVDARMGRKVADYANATELLLDAIDEVAQALVSGPRAVAV